MAGRGVDHVIDAGGAGTLAQSLEAVRVGGNVVIVGTLGGVDASLSIIHAIQRQVMLHSVAVGSRRMQLDMVRAIDANGIRPVLDQTFKLEQLGQAFAHQRAGKHFGKVIVEI